MSSVNFDAIADWYDDTRGRDERGRALAAAVAPHLDPGLPLLDVGIGTARVAAPLAAMGFGVTGVDIGFEMTRRARLRLGRRVAQADAAALPVATASFDQALSVWVLQAVGDQAAVLAEVARVLRPGGRYVVVPGTLLPASDEIGAVVTEVLRRVQSTGHPDDLHERLASVGGPLGFTVEHVEQLAPTAYAQSPNQAADLLESRTSFCLWTLDDSQWDGLVAPLVEELRTLPAPDRPRSRLTRRELVVLARR